MIWRIGFENEGRTYGSVHEVREYATYLPDGEEQKLCYETGLVCC